MKCGLYESDITPALGTEMPGHFQLRKSEGIRERLYSHAAYFENDGEKAVVIANDTIIVPDNLVDLARSEIAEKLDMKKSCVLLCASHSHTSGPTETWGDFVHEDKDFLKFFLRRLVDGAVLAAQNAREVIIGYSSGHEDKIAYYRDFVMSDGSFRTNPGLGDPGKRPFGEIDTEVGVLRIDNTDGSPYGALVNYACHCDCVGGNLFSSDYPGEMKKSLKKQYGQEFIPVFINGFSGNINHCDFKDGFNNFPDHYKRMGRMLAAVVMRAREYSVPFEDHTISGADHTMEIPTREPDEELIKWADENLKKPKGSLGVIDEFYTNETKRFQEQGVEMCDAVVQVIRIGEMALFGLPGEIFVEFGFKLKEKSPFKYNMNANLANGCIGYVLIKELFQPGIYEARLCSSSKVIPEAGYIMTDKLLELAETI